MTDILKLMETVNGASFIGLTTETEVKLKGGKKNPMQGRVTKTMTGANVMVFQNKKSNGYENMVERRLQQEGKNPESFKLGPRAWGERIPNTPIIAHKDKRYLEVIFLKSGKVTYFLDGNEIERDQIEGLGEPAEGKQGGLENKVIIRTFAVSNITEIKIDGNTYTGPFE